MNKFKSKSLFHRPLIDILPISKERGVCQNGERNYNATRNLWDLFSTPGLAKEIWNNDHHLINVHEISDEELKSNVWAGTLQFFLKHIYERDVMSVWEQIGENLPELAKIEVGVDYIKVLLAYSLTKIPEDDKVKVRNLLQTKLGEKKGEEIMVSLAERWYRDGEAKGKAEGIAEERNQMVIKMLEQNIDPKFIAKVTGYTPKQIENLKQNKNK